MSETQDHIPSLPTLGVPHPVLVATREQAKPMIKVLGRRLHANPKARMHSPFGKKKKTKVI